MDLEYTDGALDDLRELPLRHADQITRKVERLRTGLVGDIRHLPTPRLAIGCARVTIAFCSTAMGKLLW